MSEPSGVDHSGIHQKTLGKTPSIPVEVPGERALRVQK